MLEEFVIFSCYERITRANSQQKNVQEVWIIFIPPKINRKVGIGQSKIRTNQSYTMRQTYASIFNPQNSTIYQTLAPNQCKNILKRQNLYFKQIIINNILEIMKKIEQDYLETMNSARSDVGERLIVLEDIFQKIQEVIHEKLQYFKDKILNNVQEILRQIDPESFQSSATLYKRSLGNAWIKCEIEITQKIKSTQFTNLKDVELTLHSQNLNKYLLIVFLYQSFTLKGGDLPAPCLGIYDITLQPVNTSTRFKYQIIRERSNSPLIQERVANFSAIQIQIPKRIPQNYWRFLKVKPLKSNMIDQIQIFDSFEKIDFKLYNNGLFYFGLKNDLQYPFREWHLGMTKNAELELTLDTCAMRLTFLFADSITVTFLDQKIMSKSIVDILLQLRDQGINLICSEDILETMECIINAENEKLAARDISLHSRYFLFHSVAGKINGRAIEVDIKEDYEGERHFIDLGQLMNDNINRIRWFNSKVRVVLGEDQKTINYAYLVQNDTQEQEFVNKYKKYMQYPSLQMAVNALNISQSIVKMISKRSRDSIQNGIIRNQQLFKFLMLTKILVMTGR